MDLQRQNETPGEGQSDRQNSSALQNSSFPKFEVLVGVPSEIYDRLQELWVLTNESLSHEERGTFLKLVPRAKLGRTTRTIINQCIAQELKAKPHIVNRAHHLVLKEIFGPKALVDRNWWPIFRQRYPHEAAQTETEAGQFPRIRTADEIPCAVSLQAPGKVKSNDKKRNADEALSNGPAVKKPRATHSNKVSPGTTNTSLIHEANDPPSRVQSHQKPNVGPSGCKRWIVRWSAISGPPPGAPRTELSIPRSPSIISDPTAGEAEQPQIKVESNEADEAFPVAAPATEMSIRDITRMLAEQQAEINQLQAERNSMLEAIQELQKKTEKLESSITKDL